MPRDGPARQGLCGASPEQPQLLLASRPLSLWVPLPWVLLFLFFLALLLKPKALAFPSSRSKVTSSHTFSRKPPLMGLCPHLRGAFPLPELPAPLATWPVLLCWRSVCCLLLQWSASPLPLSLSVLRLLCSRQGPHDCWEPLLCTGPCCKIYCHPRSA